MSYTLFGIWSHGFYYLSFHTDRFPYALPYSWLHCSSDQQPPAALQDQDTVLTYLLKQWKCKKHLLYWKLVLDLRARRFDPLKDELRVKRSLSSIIVHLSTFNMHACSRNGQCIQTQIWSVYSCTTWIMYGTYYRGDCRRKLFNGWDVTFL